MLNVTEEQIEAYNSNSIHKQLIVRFPQDLSWAVKPENIVSESMTLKEMLLDGKNVEFVGCNSSEFSIKLKGIYFDAKNRRIEVSIKTDDTDEIPLFKGYVYSAKKDENADIKEIKAYDILYKKGQIDVAQWYQQLAFPITLKAFRKSLFEYIELPYVDADLPNDNLTFDRQYDPNTLKCLSVLKAICQINGCFGIINREEKFEFRFLNPSTGEPSNNFTFAKRVRREDFYVKEFDGVMIRDNEQDAGVYRGDSTPPLIANKYIIQANMFMYKLDHDTKATVATNIFNAIQGVSFTPVETNNNGMPFVEVGDTVAYTLGNSRASQSRYRVLNRELNGIQALRDSYGADGDEEASSYVTDLQTQIDTIKQSGGGGAPEDVYTKEETDERIEEIIAKESMQVVSCAVLPAEKDRDIGTIYLVQGDLWLG